MTTAISYDRALPARPTPGQTSIWRSWAQETTPCGKAVAPATWFGGLVDHTVGGEETDLFASGDNDLLVLHPFAGIPIVEPATFLQMLDGEESARP